MLLYGKGLHSATPKEHPLQFVCPWRPTRIHRMVDGQERPDRQEKDKRGRQDPSSQPLQTHCARWQCILPLWCAALADNEPTQETAGSCNQYEEYPCAQLNEIGTKNGYTRLPAFDSAYRIFRGWYCRRIVLPHLPNGGSALLHK